MNDTKIVLKEHLCKRCNKKVIQRIELRLGLNNKGEYTNKYCLNCDARLRESDIKEVRTDFDCPNCKSFLNSGFVNVCGGCGGFLSWVTLDGKMFKLPKEEFKKKLIEMLIPLTHIQEPKNKHEVEIKEFMCPFCEHKETINVREQIWNENTKGWEVIGVDYWECQKCGEENDIGLESFEKDFKIFKKFTEKNDWDGLRNFCHNNKFDDFMLYSLAKYYIQQREFEKVLNIAKLLVEINPRDICSEELIEKAQKGLEFIKNKELNQNAKLNC